MSKKLTFTILSISLLTVMAGAAVAPALGIIKEHFSDADPMLVKFIVSMPALFIIIMNLMFTQVCKVFCTRTIALIGLCMYVACGTGAVLVDDMASLLVLRALLGVSVGLIMPLSTGLLAYYFPPAEMARLMGLSAAMNQMGGVVATLLAGVLATIQWNYAFLVYALGLLAIVLVVMFLPNEKLRPDHGFERNMIRRFHPSIVGMLLCMGIFFVFVTNFAITETGSFDAIQVTWLMVGTDLIAFFVGMLFGKIMNVMPRQMKFMAPLAFLVGFALLAFCQGTTSALLGCIFIGIANGLGIPYLNTIASIKGGKESVTTVMPLISASLYLGQFFSPIVVGATSSCLFADDMRGPYKVAIILAVIYLVQVISTRRFQSLPPKENK